MKQYNFNGNYYYTLKDIYTNLCVTRNSLIKKIKKLEKNGYVLRIRNKKPSIYISEKGYELLKKDRIEHLDNQIKNTDMKEYYSKLKDAIGNPELWEKYHHKEIYDNLYFEQGELILIESKRNGKREICKK